jgi:hypothetical protein
MTTPPQLWLNLSTRLTSTACTNSDAADSWSFGAAVLAPNGAIEQAAVATSFQYNVSGSWVAKSYAIASNASLTLSDAGVPDFQSTASFVPAGVSENVTNAAGASWERINLVYGAPTVDITLMGQCLT